VRPEEHPLGLFGPAARDAIVPTLDALGIELIARSQPREIVGAPFRHRPAAADRAAPLVERVDQVGDLNSSYQSVVSGAFLAIVVVVQTYISRKQRL